jgi:3-oxoacyl-[acyl-carrier-protein] synthase-3
MFKNVHIIGVGSYHPQVTEQNQFYINHFREYHTSEHVTALMNKLGRETRTLAAEDETSISMAVEAAKNALISTTSVNWWFALPL